jgi:hypothetical protein
MAYLSRRFPQLREGEMKEEIFLEAQWKAIDHSGMATPQTNHSR